MSETFVLTDTQMTLHQCEKNHKSIDTFLKCALKGRYIRYNPTDTYMKVKSASVSGSGHMAVIHARYCAKRDWEGGGWYSSHRPFTPYATLTISLCESFDEALTEWNSMAKRKHDEPTFLPGEMCPWVVEIVL